MPKKLKTMEFGKSNMQIAKVNKGKKKERTTANERPINKYIAYRCMCLTCARFLFAADNITGYYFKLVKPEEQDDEQKEIEKPPKMMCVSGFMGALWKNDPFHEKWELLAKTYNIIRDALGKEHLPLATFLDLSAPLLLIIEPGEYMATLGWKLPLTIPGQMEEQRETVAIDENLYKTSVGANELLHHCFAQGYIPLNLTDSHSLSLRKGMTLIMATGATRSEGRQEIEAGRNGESSGQTVFATASTTSNTSTNNAGYRESSNGNTPSHQLTIGTTHTIETHQPQIIDTSAVNNNTAPQLGAVTTQLPDPMNLLSSANFRLEGMWPFWGEWDPTKDPQIFEPFDGSGFNAFDLSDYNAFDLSDFNDFVNDDMLH